MSNFRKECRICFESEVTEINQLIVPCDCSGSSRYIHRECLEKWRNMNVESDAYTHCRECRGKYIIEWAFPRETYLFSNRGIIYTNTKCSLLFLYLFIISLFYRTLDKFWNSFTLGILCTNNDEKKSLIKELDDDSFLSLVFYISFVTLCVTFITYIIFFINITKQLKRKIHFWKRFTFKYLSHFFISCHFYYVYWIMKNRNIKIESELFETYINIEALLSCFNYYVFSSLLMRYNFTIIQMNRANIGIVLNKDNNSQDVIVNIMT